jgi:uncharacterized protein (TIGR00255 family)
MKSMTGYGKTVCKFKDKVVTIELKSLNSKNLDLHTRLPNIYREKDLEIRNLLSRKLSRGKIELQITVDMLENAAPAHINAKVVEDYFNQLSKLQNELGDKTEALLPTIMRLPESLKQINEELDDAEWKMLFETLEETILVLDKFRLKEGTVLKKDIVSRTKNIDKLLSGISKYEEERISKIKERIRSGLTEIMESDNYDSNRFEQELIYYLEKLDISEEKTRLKNHCNHFNEVAEEDIPVGKKLGFIAQEIGREVNTIGSKANHVDIQKLVVQMKDELEKAKEQLMNVL